MTPRRSFLSRVSVLRFLALPGNAAQKSSRPPLKILMKSAWGSDDPTKAGFPLLHGLALSEAGHRVQIFLLGEAVNLMRRTVVGQFNLAIPRSLCPW